MEGAKKPNSHEKEPAFAQDGMQKGSREMITAENAKNAETGTSVAFLCDLCVLWSVHLWLRLGALGFLCFFAAAFLPLILRSYQEGFPAIRPLPLFTIHHSKFTIQGNPSP
jgi:hypothetical protein